MLRSISKRSCSLQKMDQRMKENTKILQPPGAIKLHFTFQWLESC